MPNLSPLAALFRLRPDRAADYLAAKGFKLSGPYWEMDGPQHSHLFTVANLAKMDVLQDIRSAVQQALDEGQTEKWFAAQLVDVLKRKGWWGGKDGSLRRLHTIYATNLQTALMAGRHRQAMEQIDRAPWAQYMAIRDHRSRPAHAAMHGQIFRLDSPAWAAISPPCGYSCRCSARYLSDRELEKRGLKPAEDIQILEREPPGKMPVNPRTGATPQRWIQRGVSVPSKSTPGERDILWADPGWDNIPGSDGAERALVDRLMAKATDLGDGVRMAVVQDLKRHGIGIDPVVRVVAPLQALADSLKVEVKGLPGADFVASMQAVVDALPPVVRQTLGRADVRAIVANSVTGAFPRLRGQHPRGWPPGATWDCAEALCSNGTPAIAKRYRDMWDKHKWKDSRRAAYGLRHEMGHAYDYAGGGLSSDPGFRAAYDADVAAANLGDGQSKIKAYFLQDGDAGPLEAFAEAFAIATGGHADANMPLTLQWVRAMIGLGGDSK
ncbi:MAG: minor capsid protein [Chromatiaceae bacterium]|nr:minor capsid protein [Chromatiaceae bacterium]